MPTLFRLLIVAGVLTALAFAVMTAMVRFLQPQPRDITQTITLPKPAR